jgi:hypothetical protein
MENRKLKDMGSKALLFAGQIGLLILCISYITFIYTENILPDKSVAEDYGVATCTVLAKGLSTKGRIVHSYRADFQVSYAANNTTYQAIASANGLDYSFTTDLPSQQEFLDEFQVGGQYPCWYNPQRPAIVVLVLRHSWTSTFPLIIPSVIAIIMVFYMFKSLFQLLEVMAVRARQKKP